MVTSTNTFPFLAILPFELHAALLQKPLLKPGAAFFASARQKRTRFCLQH
jgi:hypothetical protein